jgi:hypothetical protein
MISFLVEEFKTTNFSISISLYLSTIQIFKLLFTHITNGLSFELNFLLIISTATLSMLTVFFFGTVLLGEHKVYISLNEKDEEIKINNNNSGRKSQLFNFFIGLVIYFTFTICFYLGGKNLI